LAGFGNAFVMMDHLSDDEVEEFFREYRIQSGICGQCSQALDLAFFASGVRRRQSVLGFEQANPLGALESLGEKMHQGGVDIVD